jgi:hypothetical protein
MPAHDEVQRETLPIPDIAHVGLTPYDAGDPDTAPVTDDYPGESPYRFIGGVIKQVRVNVSGEPYLNLEREAVAMLMRE